MNEIQLTISHYVFLLVVISIFISIGFRRGVIIPCITGIFLLGLLSGQSDGGFLNSLIFSVQIVFNALLNAGSELFDIMAVVAFMVAMLKSLESLGADHLMVAPVKRLMVGPRTSFFVLAATMYVAAAFFWPTPAVALVGTVLIPVAIRVGLPALAAAVAVNLAGHGMALAADPIIQGATKLTAGAAGIDTSDLLPYTILFSLTTGLVAISIALYTIRRDMKSGVLKPQTSDENKLEADLSNPVNDLGISQEAVMKPYTRVFAIGVPVVLLSIATLMVYRALFNPEEAIRGGDATALLGGSAVILLVLSSFASEGHRALEGIVGHLRHGFIFSIRIFAPIIPIAGFFFLGNPEHAAAVIGDGTPGFLFDIGNKIGSYVNGNVFAISFGITFIGFLTGMDGSGFSGLPLVGALSGALGSSANLDVHVLAALGQVVAIFTGGGTLVAWAFGACADAGIAGVSPADLVRRNFVPVIFGFLVTTLLAIYIML